LGVDGLSKSEVSRICAEIDTMVTPFRTRPLVGAHRYVWVDCDVSQDAGGRATQPATVRLASLLIETSVFLYFC
jgi:transposase-like protein